MAVNFADKAKGLLNKAKGAAGDHSDKIDGAIDKAADLADKATKGKYDDQIDQAAEKAKEAVDRLDQ